MAHMMPGSASRLKGAFAPEPAAPQQPAPSATSAEGRTIAPV